MRTVNKANFFRARAWLDEALFEAIFTGHYEQIYGVLFRLTGDRSEADDLTAETFWRLWERPPAQPDNVTGWLYRVATRLGYNALRDQRRKGQYEAQAGQEMWEIQPAPDPQREVEKRIERTRVRAILQQMPLRDVQILILRHTGRSYREIADALEINAASVGTLLARAENRFEALYARGDDHAHQR